MKRLIPALALLCAGVACDKPAPPASNASNSGTPPAATTAGAAEEADAPTPEEPVPAPEKSDAFELTEAHKGIVNDHSIDIKGGELIDTLRFTDKNGDNLVALWSNKELDLFASQIVMGEDVRIEREVRSIKQLRDDCEYDYSAAFIKGSLGATDLDQDGYGEVTFAYKYSCRSDMSPEDYKVLVLENGEKAILRGSDILVMPQEEPIGDGKFEAEGFEKSPEALEHAKALWKQHLVKQY